MIAPLTDWACSPTQTNDLLLHGHRT